MVRTTPADPTNHHYSQTDLCKAAGISMATANNWMNSGALQSIDLGIRTLRKPRVFDLTAIYHAKATAEMVKWLGVPPTTAAAIARRTTAKGYTWYLSIPGNLARGKSPLDAFAAVFWSDDCHDWDAWVEFPSGADILRTSLKEIAEERREPRLAHRPFLLLPVTKYFVSVYKKCEAILIASGKRQGS